MSKAKTEKQYLVMQLETFNLQGEMTLVFVDAYDTKWEARERADSLANDHNGIMIIKAETPVLYREKKS